MVAPYLGDFPASASTWYHEFPFDAGGVLTDPVGAAVAARKDNGTTEDPDGLTLTVPFDGRTGVGSLAIDFSADTGFWTAGSEFCVFFTAGTIDGIPLNGRPILYFSIERAGGALELLKSATFGLAALKTLIDAFSGPIFTVVDDVGNTAQTFKTDLTQGTDFWKDVWIRAETGALTGQVKRVTAFDTGTDFITVHAAFTAEPAAGDTFRIVNR